MVQTAKSGSGKERLRFGLAAVSKARGLGAEGEMVGEREQRRENAVGVSHGTLHLLCRKWHTVDYFPFCIIKMGDGNEGLEPKPCWLFTD